MSETPDATPSDRTAPEGTVRLLLRVAVAIVALETLAFVTLAVLDLATVDGERVGSAVVIAILLLVYGLGLAFAASRVLKGHAWARSPVVVAQLIQLLLAYNARASELAWLPVLMAVSAAVCLGCLLAPPVTRYLGAADAPPEADEPV